MKDVRTERRQGNRLRQEIEEAAEMPDVADYIMQKKEMYELQSQLQNWRKKLEIVEMAAKKSQSQALKLKYAARSAGI